MAQINPMSGQQIQQFTAAAGGQAKQSGAAATQSGFNTSDSYMSELEQEDLNQPGESNALASALKNETVTPQESQEVSQTEMYSQMSGSMIGQERQQGFQMESNAVKDPNADCGSGNGSGSANGSDGDGDGSGANQSQSV